MKTNAKTNFFIVIILLLCTTSIIFSNYIFSKQVVLNIDKQLLENEYKKIGGKDNYNILKELQKQEMIGYLNKLKEENPELIKKLKEKAEKELKESKYKILSNEIINELKQDTYIKGNSGATISIIKFSDLECEYCIKDHKQNLESKINEKYSDKINHIFKNFPLPKNKNSSKEAEAGLCVKNIAGGEKYLEFIDKVFNTTKGGGEGYDLDNLSTLVEEIGLNKEDFNKCYNENLQADNLKIEFEQGIKLGINSVPSNLIINNITGEYVLISEMVEVEDIEEIIQELLE